MRLTVAAKAPNNALQQQSWRSVAGARADVCPPQSRHVLLPQSPAYAAPSPRLVLRLPEFPDCRR